MSWQFEAEGRQAPASALKTLCMGDLPNASTTAQSHHHVVHGTLSKVQLWGHWLSEHFPMTYFLRTTVELGGG